MVVVYEIKMKQVKAEEPILICTRELKIDGEKQCNSFIYEKKKSILHAISRTRVYIFLLVYFFSTFLQKITFSGIL